MWAALWSEQGELKWLGRTLLVRTGKKGDDGKPIYQAHWKYIPRDIPAKMITHVAIMDAETGGDMIGKTPLNYEAPAMMQGNQISLNLPMLMGKQLETVETCWRNVAEQGLRTRIRGWFGVGPATRKEIDPAKAMG